MLTQKAQGKRYRKSTGIYPGSTKLQHRIEVYGRFSYVRIASLKKMGIQLEILHFEHPMVHHMAVSKNCGSVNLKGVGLGLLQRGLGLLKGRFRVFRIDPHKKYMAVSKNWEPFLEVLVYNLIYARKPPICGEYKKQNVHLLIPTPRTRAGPEDKSKAKNGPLNRFVSCGQHFW